MYTYAHIDNAFLDRIADRFDFAIEGYPQDIQYIKSKNPNFYTNKYNSLTDNYVSGSQLGEDTWLRQNAAAYGADPKQLYLHYYTDTTIRLEGQTIFIPGWNGQPDDPDEAASRVPVYYANLSRRVVNFSSAPLRALNRAFNLTVLNTPVIGTIMPGGIFFDNAFYSNTLMENTGEILSGGEILEHPTRAKIKSLDFSNWYWFNGAGQFLKEFRDFLDTDSSISARSLKLVPNVANMPAGQNDWINGYVNLKAGHTLFEEFNCSPTRCIGHDSPFSIFTKNLAAVNNGVSTFETGYLSLSAGSYGGTFTEKEAIENNVGLAYVTAASNNSKNSHSYHLFNPIWQVDVNKTQWELNLLPITDVDLGQPLSDPFILQSGTDPVGNAYKVYARRFACGMAMVRTREWNEGVDLNTTVNVPLGGSYQPVTPDGAILGSVSSFSIRNGQAKVFLSPFPAPTPDAVAPAAPSGLSVR